MALIGAECVHCGKRTGLPLEPGLCECGGPRLARYDLENLAKRRDLKIGFESRPPTLLSRWMELMPFADAQILERVSMGETRRRAMGEPDVQARFAALALDADGRGPEEFRQLIDKDVKRWKETAAKANIKFD